MPVPAVQNPARLACAFLDLLDNHVVAEITPAMLARQSGISEKVLGDILPAMDDLLPLLVAEIDAVVAKVRVDPRDPPADRLLELLMTRIDALQKNRAAYLNVLAYMKGRPRALAALAPVLLGSMQALLRQAQLPDGKLAAACLMAAFGATLPTWEKDTQADLPATMRILDRNLRRALQAATWLGFDAGK